MCPRSSDPFYIVSDYIKWVTTSWTHSKVQISKSVKKKKNYLPIPGPMMEVWSEIPFVAFQFDVTSLQAWFLDFHLTSVISCTFSIHMYKLFFVKNLPDYSRQLCVFSGWFVVCCVAVILEREECILYYLLDQ